MKNYRVVCNICAKGMATKGLLMPDLQFVANIKAIIHHHCENCKSSGPSWAKNSNIRVAVVTANSHEKLPPVL